MQGPKELDTHPGDSIVGWAEKQLTIARSIMEDPGGGLLFATQTIGQVKAGLRERDAARWDTVTAILERAENSAVHREYATASGLLKDALAALRSS